MIVSEPRAATAVHTPGDQNGQQQDSRKDSLKKRALQGLNELPPFSPVLNRLMASLADEDVSVVKLADLIEMDPVLAGNMLSLVNSALYARRSTVNSVRHAVALLGIGKIRNATLGMSISSMWNRLHFPPWWSMKDFNLHSAGTAVLADQIALEATVEYPEGAFAAGLLHDLGKLLIATVLPAEAAAIQQRRTETGEPHIDCEMAVLGFTHAELSELALDAWSLPPAIAKAAGTHHHPWPAPTGVIPLGQVIGVADGFTRTPDVDSILALGIPPPRAEKLLANYELELAALSPLIR